MMSHKKCRKCGSAYHDNQPCVTNVQEFYWKYGGKCVFLSGSWSQWQVKIPMRPMCDNPGTYFTTVNLIPGIYRYKYEVDGRWVHDESVEHSENAFGVIDNLIEVVPAISEYSYLPSEIDQELDCEPINFAMDSSKAVIVKIATTIEGPLKIKGSWDNWKSEIKMNSKFYQALNCTENVVFLLLNQGNYEYKFVVHDTHYQHDPNKFSKSDNFGGFNNYIKVLEKQSVDLTFAFNNKKKIQTLDVLNLKWTKIDVEELNFSAIQGHSINLFKDEFFIFGGFHHGKFLDTLRCVNAANLQIEQPCTTGKSPEARAYHNALIHGDRLIIYGGLNEWKVFNNYYVLNTINMNWLKVETYGELPSPREKCSFNNIMDEFLVLFGGYACSHDFEAEYDYNDVFTMNLSTLFWKKQEMKGNLPESRYGHTTNIYKRKLYLFGGIHRTGEKTKCFNDIHVINFIKNENLQWEKLEVKGERPIGRYGHSATIINENLIIYGGRDVDGQLLDDVGVFDLKENNWVKIMIEGASPGARWLHASLNFNNSEMVIFGGAKAMKTGRLNAIYSLNSGQTNLQYTPSVPGTPKLKQKKKNLN